MCVCGTVWIVRLTTCLALYDPLLILPLMVGTYVLFGGLAGGIFFQEFGNLGDGPAGFVLGWTLYLSGMALVLLGLGLIAAASVRVDREIPAHDDATAKHGALGKGGALGGTAIDAPAPDELEAWEHRGHVDPDASPSRPVAEMSLPPLELTKLSAREQELTDAIDECKSTNVRLRRHVRPSSSAAQPAAPAARLRVHRRIQRVQRTIAKLTQQLGELLGENARAAYEGEPVQPVVRGAEVAIEIGASGVRDVSCGSKSSVAMATAETRPTQDREVTQQI